MEASFEMKVDKLMVKGVKRGQKYDNENKDQFEDDEEEEEEEEENDLITTYAVVCILIFILMNLIYKSIFNIFFYYVIEL